MTGMVGDRLQFEIVGTIVALVLINVVRMFTRQEQSSKFVFQKDNMERIEAFGILPWMRWIGPAVPIPAAFAY